MKNKLHKKKFAEKYDGKYVDEFIWIPCSLDPEVLKIFTKIYKYDACVLVLGDSDISDNKTCDLEKNLDEIVSLLISKDIKPVIINDKNYYNNYEALENKIEKLLKKYNLNVAKENSDKLNLKYGF